MPAAHGRRAPDVAMAICLFQVKSVSRGQGSSAVQRSAYIARDKVRDERRGQMHDYRSRGGLVHSEILVPSRVVADGAAWAQERATLWNRAEAAEPRANARVAREYVVGLPHELTAEQRLDLARTFARRVMERYGTAVEVAVHRAPPGGDERNHHAHFLATTREAGTHGLGAKSVAEWNDDKRRLHGLPPSREEIRLLRHEWADLVNERLRAAECAARIDARSLWEQGSARVPVPRIPRAALYAERRDGYSPVVERLREQHAAEQARLSEFAAAHAARTSESQPLALPEVATREPVPDLDATRRRAIERWLAFRAASPEQRDGGAARPREPALERGRDRDAGMEL